MGMCFSHEDDFLESVVCRENELLVGQLKEVKLGDESKGENSGLCVVVKDEKGKIHALSGKCTHYGASLAKGSYSEGTVRCPWHGACFDVNTGDLEDFPGLDSLQKYDVRVTSEGEVKVRAKKDLVGQNRVRTVGCREARNSETIVVIGGGAAAQSCVEALRQEQRFAGRVMLITKESNLPYDRPKLSKALNSSATEIRLRDPGFYGEVDIEVMTETEVIGVNTETKELSLRSGGSIKYDKLVLATGSTPRTLNVEGKELKNIFVLRTPEEANTIANAGKGKHVVIVGASFIGMEVAAYFADKASSVTVIGHNAVPFQQSLGPEIGKYVQSMHESKGVKFIMSDDVAAFRGDDTVKEIVLENGEPLSADLVILGVGVVPNTGFLQDSGISLHKSGSVLVNDRLETNVPGVFAAGDIARFPLACADNQEVSIGHWQLAMSHGRCAALNAASNRQVMKSVPFFWTAQYGKSIRYAGYASGYDALVIDGSVEGGEFAAYYCKGDTVVAIATLGKDPLAADFANLLASGKRLDKAKVHGDWMGKGS